MGRTLPYECHHGVTVDWGDFGPCQGYCDEVHPNSEDCPDSPGCPKCDVEEAGFASAVARLAAARAVIAERPDVIEAARAAVAHDCATDTQALAVALVDAIGGESPSGERYERAGLLIDGAEFVPQDIADAHTPFAVPPGITVEQLYRAIGDET